MVKKQIHLQQPLTQHQKHRYSRALAENNNVKRVVFTEDQVIVHLYRRVPTEALMEELPLPEVPVVSVE